MESLINGAFAARAFLEFLCPQFRTDSTRVPSRAMRRAAMAGLFLRFSETSQKVRRKT